MGSQLAGLLLRRALRKAKAMVVRGNAGWRIEGAVALLCAAGTLACGCDPPPPAGTDASAAATGSATELVQAAADDDDSLPDAGQKRGEANKAGERVTIPAGKLSAGSTPGDRGRDPTLEPVELQLELGEFSIDKLPYPNEPGTSPKVEVSRSRAEALCKERQGRLCSEIEWERACRGNAQQPFAGASAWEPSCASAPASCASEFGVLALGGGLREWTASPVQASKKFRPAGVAVRGAGAKAPAADHRCARRSSVAADESAKDLGFRCCYGDANATEIPSPQWQSAFKRHELPADRLQKLFAADPRLKDLAVEIKYFTKNAAIDTIRRRGRARGQDAGADPPENTRMDTAPLLWNPVPGEEIVLVTGRTEKDAFIVALHRLPNDRYRVGSALTMKGETGPIVFIYNPYTRRKLMWATCWECYGETGNITYRDENRVVITQR